MSTLKANKDKARFISNTISQDELDTDWVDHEVITKYKLPEIVVDASTTESLLVSPDLITTGDKLKVLDGANMVDRTAGTVTTDVTAGADNLTNPNFDTDTSGWASGHTGFEVGGVAVLSWESGSIKVLNSGIVNGSATQLLTGLEIGVEYTVTITSGANAIIGVGNDTTSVLSNTAGLSHIFTASATSHYLHIGTLTADSGVFIVFDNVTISPELITKYQAPITATTNIPTKAYFNKTIDTTLSAEATGKCKSSTITQIGVL